MKIWHPFTSVLNSPLPKNIVKSKGSILYTDDNQEIIDAISSWWVNLFGHCRPEIAQAISKQTLELEQVIFAGFTHPKAIELSEKLSNFIPSELNHLFFSDDGSTSVEVALKLALQFYHNQGITKKYFVALEDAYHGDTFGAMSASGKSIFNASFQNLMFDVLRIPVPNENNLDEVLDLMEHYNSKYEIAGFIFEPLVLGAGGMIMYTPSQLEALLQKAKSLNWILIADEVMTGNGRTGTFLATQQQNVIPDLVCISKGITGGFLPIGLTVCNDKIHEVFQTNDKTKTFFHGHSYTGNSLACAAACATLDLHLEINSSLLQKNINILHNQVLNSFFQSPKIINKRITGTILAMDIETENAGYLNNLSRTIHEKCLEKGVLIRPLGNVVYILPPLTISESELYKVYEVLESVINIL